MSRWTNIHSKFAGRTLFVNIGLFLVSILFCVQFLTGNRTHADAALIDPAAAFALAALVIGIGSFSRHASAPAFSAWRDCLPLLAFASANLLAGHQRPWVWAMFWLAVVVSAVLVATRRHGDYDEDADRITIRPRWPF